MAKKKETKQIEDKTESAFDKLSDVHKIFVLEYVKHFSKGIPAYKIAYPTVKNNNVAAANSSRLLLNANIQAAIDEEYRKFWKDKDSERERSKTYKMIHVIGESNIADIIDLENNTLTVKSLDQIPIEAQQAIQSIDYIEKESPNGTIERNIKIKMHNKLQALELRAKIQNMLQDKVDVSGEITVKPAMRPTNTEEIE